MAYSLLTPYIIPGWKKKAVNAGDGFIYDSVEKLIGLEAAHKFSAWAPLSDMDIAAINQTSLLVVAGANTLKDDFTLCPEFDLDTLAKIEVPIALCGLGHYGVAEMTQGLSQRSIGVLDAILERFPLMSVRCDASRDYLISSARHLSENVLMTSCPVVYPVDGIHGGFEKKEVYNHLIVTVTDRSHLEPQLALIHGLPKLLRAKQFTLALHQDYNNSSLWEFARNNGYSVFRSKNYQDFISLYKSADLHIGNRLHAHLKCLSIGRPSFLLPFDLRQVYFSDSLKFPLLNQLPHPALSEWDFETPMSQIAQTRPQMDKFITAIKAAIGL